MPLEDRSEMSSCRPGEAERSRSALQTQVGGNHYKGLVIQPAEYVYKNGIDYLSGNVIKYVSRFKQKNGLEDLKKAYHYIELLAKIEYNIDLKSSS